MYQAYLSELSALAANHFCRFGVVLKGDNAWKHDTLTDYLRANVDSVEAIFQLGGKAQTVEHENITCVAAHKGLALLGQECQVLICDFSEGYDANSFSAAIGTLVGGGLLFVVGFDEGLGEFSQQWVTQVFSELIFIEQREELPLLPYVTREGDVVNAQHQQQIAVDNIKKVLNGHRKRPLVLTANRGRGKSSSLGIAAGQLLMQRKMRILVTAPKIANVEPVFSHALRVEPSAALKSKSQIVAGDSSLEFIAPDELLLSQPECDLLLVDEASAIPLPMLKAMVERYHRIVFSTTIHGYEGCGRGFTLKFLTWLKIHRPGTSEQHLDAPFRWTRHDPLESWHYRAMLLDAELELLSDVPIQISQLTWRRVDKQELLDDIDFSRRVFALLINAHYQTTPNDLLLLLDDESYQLSVCQFNNGSQRLVGCVLTIREGELAPELVADIQLGRRRPKGHLVAAAIANHCGITQAATESSLRVSRIAVHPDCQGQGIGQWMLNKLTSESKVAYLSTSFGVTTELANFWRRAGFLSVRLGTQRDGASGCYSIMMVKANNDVCHQWAAVLSHHFEHNILALLANSLSQLEPDLLVCLLSNSAYEALTDFEISLLSHYSQGGNSYDSCAHLFGKLINETTVATLSSLFINRVLKKKAWNEAIIGSALTGKKQAEQRFRTEIGQLLDHFTV
ncbi:GNAT family N-acetyltransferase [Vibrio maerlii]|uniref:GNAT family N-acetyltransferase n=1 Tax=Vibrio maerlii TaxID=2231648 RepID=UPI000E3DD51F|nr:GNAT family N-acetyltransferase [Vibrio maerlii]